jgi:chromate reductase, NAD(P)H dehydrogenase (quinone)
MKNIIAFAGSNSKVSINKQLAVYAASLVDDVNVTVLDLNDYSLPLYGMDLENEKGFPENAHKFLDLLKNTDGIILSLAEHNGAYSTVFKNLFDWLTRIDGKMFFNKPMLLMATSPGGRGGLTVLEIAKGRFPFHDANIVEDFSLPFFGNNFSDGKITNEDFDGQLKNAVQQFKKAL